MASLASTQRPVSGVAPTASLGHSTLWASHHARNGASSAPGAVQPMGLRDGAGGGAPPAAAAAAMSAGARCVLGGASAACFSVDNRIFTQLFPPSRLE